jgi:hypothetical protein
MPSSPSGDRPEPRVSALGQIEAGRDRRGPHNRNASEGKVRRFLSEMPIAF